MIFFLHIPKTAGTTFYEVVKRNHSLFLKPKIESFPLDYLSQSILKSNSAIRLPGGYESAPRTLKIIEGLSAEKLKNISFIGGHVGFGFHENCNEEVIYISFLRNPKERLISDYKEHCKKGRFFNDILLKNDFNFNVYLNAVKEYKLDNIMTRQLAGPYDFFLEKGIEVGERLFEKAKFNSKSVLFFDMENFDEALRYLNQNLGWNKQSYQPKNISSTFPYNIDVDDELINEIIYYDLKLFNEIKVVNFKKTSWLHKLFGN